MKIFIFLLFLLFHIDTAFSAVATYAQCGGIGWSGETTCVDGSVCTYINSYLSQCQPATGSWYDAVSQSSALCVIPGYHTTSNAGCSYCSPGVGWAYNDGRDHGTIANNGGSYTHIATTVTGSRACSNCRYGFAVGSYSGPCYPCEATSYLNLEYGQDNYRYLNSAVRAVSQTIKCDNATLGSGNPVVGVTKKCVISGYNESNTGVTGAVATEGTNITFSCTANTCIVSGDLGSYTFAVNRATNCNSSSGAITECAAGYTLTGGHCVKSCSVNYWASNDDCYMQKIGFYCTTSGCTLPSGVTASGAVNLDRVGTSSAYRTLLNEGIINEIGWWNTAGGSRYLNVVNDGTIAGMRAPFMVNNTIHYGTITNYGTMAGARDAADNTYGILVTTEAGVASFNGNVYNYGMISAEAKNTLPNAIGIYVYYDNAEFNGNIYNYAGATIKGFGVAARRHGGIVFSATAKFNGFIYNAGTIYSDDGFAIQNESSSVLKYQGNGVLTGRLGSTGGWDIYNFNRTPYKFEGGTVTYHDTGIYLNASSTRFDGGATVLGSGVTLNFRNSAGTGILPLGAHTISNVSLTTTSTPTFTNNGSTSNWAANSYRSLSGSVFTYRCNAGYYGADGATSCTQCPAGKYCPQGSTAATSCPSGTTSTAGSDSLTDCTACPVGQYLSGTSCVSFSCPAGTYKWTNPDMTAASTVSNGYTYIASASGTYSSYYPYNAFDKDASYPWDGNPGSWIKLDFGGEEVQIRSVRISNNTRWTSENPTAFSIVGNNANGNYTLATVSGRSTVSNYIDSHPYTGSTYFTNLTFNGMNSGYTGIGEIEISGCAKCPAGTYKSSSSTATSCTQCTQGYYCGVGATSQTICPVGYYCPAGSAEPTQCYNGSTLTTGQSSVGSCLTAAFPLSNIITQGTEVRVPTIQSVIHYIRYNPGEDPLPVTECRQPIQWPSCYPNCDFSTYSGCYYIR